MELLLSALCIYLACKLDWLSPEGCNVSGFTETGTHFLSRLGGFCTNAWSLVDVAIHPVIEAPWADMLRLLRRAFVFTTQVPSYYFYIRN